MSSLNMAYYSLDYDPDFKEMLDRMSRSSLHSSTVGSPTTLKCGMACEERRGNIGSPSIIDLTESPLGNKKESLNCTHPVCMKESYHRTNRDEVTFDLSGYESEGEEEEDVGEVNSSEFDMNSTYTAKTMGPKRLSFMLDALRASEEQQEDLRASASPTPTTPQSNGQMEQAKRSFRLINISNFTAMSNVSLKTNMSTRSVRDENFIGNNYDSFGLDVSPHTPENKVTLKPERSYRLGHITTRTAADNAASKGQI